MRRWRLRHSGGDTEKVLLDVLVQRARTEVSGDATVPHIKMLLSTSTDNTGKCKYDTQQCNRNKDKGGNVD